jgi:hypothetical protein
MMVKMLYKSGILLLVVIFFLVDKHGLINSSPLSDQLKSQQQKINKLFNQVLDELNAEQSQQQQQDYIPKNSNNEVNGEILSENFDNNGYQNSRHLLKKKMHSDALMKQVLQTLSVFNEKNRMSNKNIASKDFFGKKK